MLMVRSFSFLFSGVGSLFLLVWRYFWRGDVGFGRMLFGLNVRDSFIIIFFFGLKIEFKFFFGKYGIFFSEKNKNYFSIFLKLNIGFGYFGVYKYIFLKIVFV